MASAMSPSADDVESIRGFAAVFHAFLRKPARTGKGSAFLRALRGTRRTSDQIREIRVLKDNDHWAYRFSFDDGHSKTTPWDWPEEHVGIGIRGAVCEIASQYGIKIGTDDVVVEPQMDGVWTRPDAE